MNTLLFLINAMNKPKLDCKSILIPPEQRYTVQLFDKIKLSNNRMRSKTFFFNQMKHKQERLRNNNCFGYLQCSSLIKLSTL